jgi:class 3 adenylate cyclase
MTDKDLKRKLAAILSADVKDYSRLMREDEVATIRTLTAYREVMTTLIKQHYGRVVDSVGDNLLAEFASVVDAVQGAIAIQKEVKTQNARLPEGRKMLFRIGINLGDLVVEGDRIYGDGVNLAARLEALADPGGICISRTAYDQIEDKLPLGYEYLGEKTVKNTVKPVRAYKVVFDPEKDTIRVKIKTWAKQRQAGPEDLDKLKESEQTEKRHRYIIINNIRLRKHFLVYVVVIVFLFIVNMLTWNGVIWFHWPALGWGLLLYLAMINSAKNNGATRKERAKIRIHKHLVTYLGVIGFLFMINMLTWNGTIWFHWPALGWGLLLFFHWIKYSNTSPG